MAFVGVLMAMLIVAVLYFGYFKAQGPKDDMSSGVVAIDVSRNVACRTQRQGVERDILMWTINHPGETPTLATLRAEGVRIPDCPEGGTYRIEGKQLLCSLHD